MLNTALITGGSRGIGAAIVREFCAAGIQTAFVCSAPSEAAQIICNQTGAYAIFADLADVSVVNTAFASARDKLDHIDILVNNAAISRIAPIQELSDAEYLRMVNINLNAAYLFCKAAIPDMVSRKAGRIINISSIWGLHGASCEVAYSATKAGLIGLTQALAREVAPSGITVNAVAPGVTDTKMNAGFSPEELTAIIDEIPCGRMSTTDEVARLVHFLVSDAASYITAQTIGIDGGML